MGTKQQLSEYFGGENISAALDRYAEFAKNSGWSVEHKLDLYIAGAAAFDETRAQEERTGAFDVIYSSLSSWWQVFRPLGAARCWSSEKILSNIAQIMARWMPVAGARLRTFGESPEDARIDEAIAELAPLKPTNGFPTMAVSKFLHFCNPRLFPIYDKAVIWEHVFVTFWNDWDSACRSKVLNPDAWGAEFLRNYLYWASSCIRSADTALMPIFADWFINNVSPEKHAAALQLDLPKLDATAFEFVAIGAAFLEEDAARGSKSAARP